MIIKMTVHDNDFTPHLENFCKTFWKDFLFGQDDDYDNMTVEEKYNWWKLHRKLQEMVNPNNDNPLTNPQRNIVCEQVRKLWNKYVDKHKMSENSEKSYEDDAKAYMKKCFHVQINYQMQDKWENGEVVYFFTTNQKFITQ